MRLVTIKFPNSNRGYDYIVPADWRRKIKVGDTVVVPPSSFKSESQEVKVIAVGAEARPNIRYVELIGYSKTVKDGETREAEIAQERKARARAEDEAKKYLAAMMKSSNLAPSWMDELL